MVKMGWCLTLKENSPFNLRSAQKDCECLTVLTEADISNHDWPFSPYWQGFPLTLQWTASWTGSEAEFKRLPMGSMQNPGRIGIRSGIALCFRRSVFYERSLVFHLVVYVKGDPPLPQMFQSKGRLAV